MIDVKKKADRAASFLVDSGKLHILFNGGLDDEKQVFEKNNRCAAHDGRPIFVFGLRE